MVERVATVPLQQSLLNGINIAQRKLADTQAALNTGKKAKDLAGLGSDSARVLSSRAMMESQKAVVASTKKLSTTLSLYDANISSIDSAASTLRTAIMTASGTGESAGLQSSIEGAFDQIRAALNAKDGSQPLFAGAQTDGDPFTPKTLADTVGATVATSFTDDGVKQTARIGDGQDMTYGIGASTLGGGMLAAFRTLAEAGTIGATPTAAQTSAFNTAMTQIDTALGQVRAADATNGLKQQQVDDAQTRAQDRSDLLEGFVSDAEDADWGQLTTDLSQQQLILKASYSVFSQLAGLSLVDYLK